MLNAISTDLYELTMIGGYYVTGLSGRATFDLFVRQLPPTRTYLVGAGLEQALDFLESLRFTPQEIAFLRTVPALARLPHSFFDDYLPGLRFTGDVSAIPEGTPVFAHEPLMRVTAPLAEAQLVETALIAEVMFPTSVASRASRVVDAAAGRCAGGRAAPHKGHSVNHARENPVNGSYRPAAPTEEAMTDTKYPAGWDEERVKRVLDHYEQQTDDEAVAEDEAADESTTHTAMEVPVDLNMTTG